MSVKKLPEKIKPIPGMDIAKTTGKIKELKAVVVLDDGGEEIMTSFQFPAIESKPRIGIGTKVHVECQFNDGYSEITDLINN
ncbi:hypothetical protein ACFLZ2_05465 [Candidatus Margulisiibacteriota bacterium]